MYCNRAEAFSKEILDSILNSISTEKSALQYALDGDDIGVKSTAKKQSEEEWNFVRKNKDLKLQYYPNIFEKFNELARDGYSALITEKKESFIPANGWDSSVISLYEVTKKRYKFNFCASHSIY